MAGNFKDLVVWQKAIALVQGIYELTRAFPSDEKFGLVAQLRRAAVSIPSNIAEGQARRTAKEFIHFISTAEGSLAEIETQVIIAEKLGFTPPDRTATALDSIHEVQRMLNALRRSISAAP